MKHVGIEDIVGVVAAANRPDDISNAQCVAEENRLPFHIQPFKKNKYHYQIFLKGIKNRQADIFIVNAYSMVLDEIVLSYAKLGAFNVHGGLLPQYRGANVLNWVLINGESETGVTIHKMDAGIDTGDIIAQCCIPIFFEDTAVTLRERLFQAAGKLLSDTIPKIKSRTFDRMKQDEIRAKSWPARKAEDGLIDWSWPTERIYNLMRALVHPWPGTFYFNKSGEKVVIDYFMKFEEVEEMKRNILLDA